MRYLNTREEMATAINGRTMTTVRIDLADADEYGIKSQKVVIDNGTFKDGFPYMIRAEIRAYRDERKFTFSSGAVGLSASFTFQDMEEMLEYSNAPVIKPDSDVILVILDSRRGELFKPIILHTGSRINPHCMTPLTFTDEDNDATTYLIMAGVKIKVGATA